MDLLLKNKINTALQHLKSLEIINSTDFYFQKAEDALQDFLQLEVTEETKAFLLTNRKEYNELKQLFEDSQDLVVFGKLLFSVITYCDSNAHRKRELNRYDDKRVLALAFVRMNHWVEQLITYKFEGQLSEGSVKNAVEYLLNPIDNFTMLSENHRSQISENLFKKTYNKATFKDDFLNFFSEFSVTIRNPENYTHLLTRIAYNIEIDWKDSLIGLICPDTTGWQEKAIKDSENGNHIALWNHKKPNGTSNTLKLLRQSIEEKGYFRIFYTSSYKVNYVAEVIDFVGNQNELNKAKWPENYGDIGWYDDDWSFYKDGSKTASWIYLARKIEKVNPSDYLDFQYYKTYGYPSVGCQAPVVSYKNSLEIKYKNQMNQYSNLLQYKKQIILQGPPGTGKTREAKLIALEMLGLVDVKDLKGNDQFKLIQFHPSYTYEDFVRGIISKPNENGEGVLFKTENKILAEFAEKALKNKLNSQKGATELSKEKWLNEQFEQFVYFISENIEEQEKIELTESVFIVELDEDAFRYKGLEGWSKKGNRMLFKDIKQAYLDENFERQDLIHNQNLSGLAKWHASYYVRVLDMFKTFLNENKLIFVANTTEKEALKNYVLIIDEINRANLSSVLGELIYALEYRGEAVESMYNVDGNELTLPPNLYIIGTMNTADRSVGHIDYAIRRRFAFVDVQPKNLKVTQGLEGFDDVLFNIVADLFETNLSHEFEKKDVQLGHSYFIDKSKDTDGAPMTIRLEYEIKPILFEYVKDGILIGEDIKQKIEALTPSI